MYKNIKFVLKRDGTYEDYEISKLQESIECVLKKVNEYNEQDYFLTTTAKKISFIVSDKLNDFIKGDETHSDFINVDFIHTCVCDELFSIGYNQTARMFIQSRCDELLSEKDKIISSLKNELRIYKGDDHE